MKKNIKLILAGVAIALISILGTLQYQKTQIPHGPESAKTALRITNIIEKQLKAIHDAEYSMNPGYALYRVVMDEPVGMDETDKVFKQEYEDIIKYNQQVKLLNKKLQPLRLEAKYDPVVKDVLERYKEKIYYINREAKYAVQNKFDENKENLIKHYKAIQIEMKLKKTDPHYIRLQKSIDTWEEYHGMHDL